MEELHGISQLLIERETDKDQFERLLAGEPEESVIADQSQPEPEPPPEPEPDAAVDVRRAGNDTAGVAEWPRMQSALSPCWRNQRGAIASHRLGRVGANRGDVLQPLEPARVDTTVGETPRPPGPKLEAG
jgi:hypothetical protein